MSGTKVVVTTVVVVAWLAGGARPVSAEWFGDFYVSRAFTQSHDVDVRTTTSDTTNQDVGFDHSFLVGGRGGYWFEKRPDGAPRGPFPYFGFGLDVSHFRPDISAQTVIATVCTSSCDVEVHRLADLDLHVTAIAFDLMLRWPLLTSQKFPRGQLQPYLTVGPAIFVVNAHDRTNFGPPSHQSDRDTSVGVKVGAGVGWQFTQLIGMFGEYRFTHFHSEFDFNPATTVDTTVNTHTLLVGVSFHF